jgi:hypothetical protein
LLLDCQHQQDIPAHSSHFCCLCFGKDCAKGAAGGGKDGIEN